MKKTILFILVLAVTCISNAQERKSAWDEIQANPCISGGSYLIYPYTNAEPPKQTAAPKGYKPFYMSHYGRHGSRWLTSAKTYALPVVTMQKADEQSKLTQRGKQVLAMLKDLQQAADKRNGELTPKGARQHQGIARRMVRNFPEIFRGNAQVDCKSSTSMRCALSMLNEVKEIQAFNPKLQITTDASAAEMWFIAPVDQRVRDLESVARKGAIHDFAMRHLHPDRLMASLFSDAAYAKDSIQVWDFVQALYTIASNQQSADDAPAMYDLFTPRELYDCWLYENAQWYVVRGPSPLTEGYMPSIEKTLLQNIIDNADRVIAEGGHGANLRFGHDSNLMPLTILLGIGDYGRVFNDLEELEGAKWKCHEIVPMAGNIQLVFYRKNKSDDVLVKALQHECEVSLPITTDQFPYYHWKDLRAYYLQKLGK